MCPKGDIVAPVNGGVIIRSSGVSSGFYLARLKFRTCIVEDPQCVVREIPPALVGGELVIGVGFCRESKPILVTGRESARHAIIQNQAPDGAVAVSQVPACGLTDRSHILLGGFFAGVGRDAVPEYLHLQDFAACDRAPGFYIYPLNPSVGNGPIRLRLGVFVVACGL